MSDPKDKGEKAPTKAPDEAAGTSAPEAEPIAIEEPIEPGDPDGQPI